VDRPPSHSAILLQLLKVHKMAVRVHEDHCAKPASRESSRFASSLSSSYTFRDSILIRFSGYQQWLAFAAAPSALGLEYYRGKVFSAACLSQDRCRPEKKICPSNQSVLNPVKLGHHADSAIHGKLKRLISLFPLVHFAFIMHLHKGI